MSKKCISFFLLTHFILHSQNTGLIKGCRNVKNIIYYDEDIYSIKNKTLKFIGEEL